MPPHATTGYHASLLRGESNIWDAQQVLLCTRKDLEEARYHLKTKLGISEKFIQHSEAFPWFGTGQGSGNSPMVWLFICSTLFDLYEERAQGATYVSPDGKQAICIKIIGFVDDTRNSTNFFEDNDNPMESLLDQATKDSQLWHDLLLTCNQSLELPKCGYHVLHHTFLPTGEPTVTELPPTNLTIQDKSGEPLKIQPQWSNSTAAKYLGTHKCLANQTTQASKLLSKCNDFARNVNTSHLTRGETKRLYWSIYRLSANYALPTCHFTFKELNKIQKKSHSAMVSKSGYNKCTAAGILYGPHYLGGRRQPLPPLRRPRLRTSQAVHEKLEITIKSNGTPYSHSHGMGPILCRHRHPNPREHHHKTATRRG
jgi:hypothetical protein